MISFFNFDGEKSKAIFPLDFIKTHFLFFYFIKDWFIEPDLEVKPLKKDFSELMILII